MIDFILRIIATVSLTGIALHTAYVYAVATNDQLTPILMATGWVWLVTWLVVKDVQGKGGAL